MLAHIWHWVVTSRYTRALEEEVLRLRAENRALVNSILGVAGVPPLKIEGSPNARANGAALNLGEAARVSNGKLEQGTQRDGPAIPYAAGFSPIRRRSWQQIGRILEHKSKSSD